VVLGTAKETAQTSRNSTTGR